MLHKKSTELNLKEKKEQLETQKEKNVLINKELAFQNREKEKRTTN